MKRIETLTEVDRLAIARTLNDAAINGKAPYSCIMNDRACTGCPVSNACSGVHVGDRSAKTFIGWLNWLFDEVDATAINTGYRVFLTDRINLYCIERDDDLNFNALYAEGRPFTALFFDQQFFPSLTVIDVFASCYGVTCVLVKDRRTNKNWIYLDKAI